MASSPVPRTLADQLRGWPDERLTALLRERADLAQPTPQDSAQVASRASARGSITRALDQLTLPELTLLRHLSQQGPSPEKTLLQDGPLPRRTASSSLERLVDLALVWGSADGWRALSQVGECLAGDLPQSDPAQLPELLTSHRDESLVERAGAGAAFEACRRVALLLDTWSTRPPAVLRTGGLGVRDLKAVGDLLQVPGPEAALLVETAAAAGLVAPTWHEAYEVWAPTYDADGWSSTSVGEQWVRLAAAWLRGHRLVGLVGTRDRAGKTWNALAPELSGIWTAEARLMALRAVAELPPGEVLAAGTGLASVVARVEWLRPRRPRTRTEQVAWAVEEAERLGVMALGGLTGAGRALLEDADAVAVLTPLLPVPVDHVLLQADLTAVAPGPLEVDLARRMHDVTDVESRGGATVHRFSAASLRRALDGGWSAADLHTFVADVSRTPVPQALTYLIDDVARTHGSIRAGYAESFLRADDETALAALLHDPKAASLGLRRIAPTVLISSTPLDVLLPRLRELGAAPVVEAPDGSVHVSRPDEVRARTPKKRESPSAGLARRTAQLAQVVHSIRVGDRAAAARPAAAADRLSPAGAVSRLREAAQAGQPVWIGYVDNHGAASERIVDPVSVEGGVLTAFDHRSEDTRKFTVHRITGVRPVDAP